jgi:ABC-type multidrug transport system fused ATPase/permease subunit
MQAWSFISQLPEGLDTRVGQSGAALSGGQRQRIALARALLRDPKLLILDEYSSALDAESEAAVQLALSEVMRDRTVRCCCFWRVGLDLPWADSTQRPVQVFIIAHRLSTIRAADVIFVLKDGRVAETGNHDQLVSLGGLYAELVKRQSSGKSGDCIDTAFSSLSRAAVTEG